MRSMRVRHVADERLDTVLGHMHSIGAHASGAAIPGSVLTVVADAVAEFKPDHILLALRSAEHANWQERGLVEHIEQRFGLPVTTYAVDPRGHASSAHGPLLLCFDGSEDARRAIERAGALFAGRRALVVTVWQPIADLNSFAWTGATASRGRPRRARSRRCRGRWPRCRRGRPRRAGGGPQGRAVGRRGDRSGVEDDRRRSLTAMTRRRSSWGREGSPVCVRCCWAASPAQSCTTPTGPRWSSGNPSRAA